MGVWIETLHPGGVLMYGVSHPVWVCGLKPTIDPHTIIEADVTPCMGVWIETE